jgi:chromosome segregation ATPase
MAFLELTAPRSPSPESASTISSKDNKMVALTPPAPSFAETTSTTSTEVDVKNTDKVSLQSSINDHKLKEIKAFDQMIAHLNAMRAKVQALESENTELKAQVEYEKSFKEHFSKNLDEANNNWHAAKLEATTKVQVLESENNDLKAQVELEKSSKEQLSNSLDEANRKSQSAEFEAASKEAELGRVRERLNLVEAQAAEQEQLHAAKEQNIELQAQIRVQFFVTTHQHIQTLKRVMHGWKFQVERKIEENYENNKLKESDSDAEIDAEYERLNALIEGYEYIIANIKKGNGKIATQIKDRREAENPTLVTHLTADRFEAFLFEREKMVAQLEDGKQEFVQMVNDN